QSFAKQNFAGYLSAYSGLSTTGVSPLISMIQFDIITIFPDMFDSYIKESLIARAQKKKLIKINVHNLRTWTTDNHQTVDDRPFGGGLGMVLKVEPIYKAVKKIQAKSAKKSKVILFTPRGK